MEMLSPNMQKLVDKECVRLGKTEAIYSAIMGLRKKMLKAHKPESEAIKIIDGFLRNIK